MHQQQRFVRDAPHEGEEVRFPRGGRRSHVHVGDQHVRPRARQIPERPHDAAEAFPALGWLDLFIVIRVQQAGHDDQRAGEAGEETGELRGDGRLCLERRKGPGDVNPCQGLLRDEPQERREPRNEVAVKAHRAVDDGDGAFRCAGEQEGGGIDRRMAVEQVDGPRGPQKTARRGAEAGEGQKTGGFRLSEMYWRMHREECDLFSFVPRNDTTYLSHCQEAGDKFVVTGAPKFRESRVTEDRDDEGRGKGLQPPPRSSSPVHKRFIPSRNIAVSPPSPILKCSGRSKNLPGVMSVP